MRSAIPFGRSFRVSGAILIWLAAVGGAYWLYRDGAGGGDVTAIAQIKQYKVSPSNLGRLVSLHVAEGQRVSEGTVLAKFDTTVLDQEMSVAAVRRQYASSEVRAAGVNLDVNTLEGEQIFEREIDAISVELQTARSEASRNRAELSKVVEATEKQRELVSKGLITTGRLMELEIQRTALEETAKDWPVRIASIESRLKASQARLKTLQQTQIENENGRHATQLQPSRDRVRQEVEALRLLQTQKDAFVLRANCDAYVSLIQARPGDVLRAGDPVMTLVEAQPRRAVAYLEERAGNGLAVGSEVRVRRRVGDRREFTANVVTVAGDVSEIPERVSTNPHIASWGRAFYLSLPEHTQIDPGEALDVRLAVPLNLPARLRASK